MSDKEEVSRDYLKTLEEVKKQYQQYAEVSRLYDLPTVQPESELEVPPPSLENPLTTNTTRIK